LFAFTMAVHIQGTVVGWQIYELTHDKLALGLIGLAEALPFIGFALRCWCSTKTHWMTCRTPSRRWRRGFSVYWRACSRSGCG